MISQKRMPEDTSPEIYRATRMARHIFRGKTYHLTAGRGTHSAIVVGRAGHRGSSSSWRPSRGPPRRVSLRTIGTSRPGGHWGTSVTIIAVYNNSVCSSRSSQRRVGGGTRNAGVRLHRFGAKMPAPGVHLRRPRKCGFLSVLLPYAAASARAASCSPPLKTIPPGRKNYALDCATRLYRFYLIESLDSTERTGLGRTQAAWWFWATRSGVARRCQALIISEIASGRTSASRGSGSS